MTVPNTTLVVSDIACRDHDVEQACRYQVAWAINPHMEIGAVDFCSAVAQHTRYVDVLRSVGAKVTRLPFLHGAYDSVFIKDPALLLERRGVKCALIAQPAHPERRVERDARRDFYARNGFEVIADDRTPTWEGGDIIMAPHRAGIFLGHGQRSDAGAARWLEQQTDLPVWPLELCDPYLYHLDTALAILPDGCALVCESALTRESMKRLERADCITNVVVVDREDALAFGLNLVAIGKKVVCGVEVPRIASVLRARGYEVEVVALDQFHLAGGSAACLVAAVHSESRSVEQPVTAPGARAMDVYGRLFRSVIKPLWETGVRRRPVLQRWELLKRTQYASLDQLNALQAHWLRRLVGHAYDHVPFYRERFRALGIRPEDIHGPEDLPKLPILRRSDLQGRTDRSSLAGPPASISKQTSGTTGEPLVFGFEPDSEHWRCAVKLRGYEWAGYRPGDKALYFWGARPPSEPAWPKQLKIALDRRVHREHHVPCDVMDEQRLRRALDVIGKVEPRVLVCYAQAGAELARYVNRTGHRPPFQPMSIICGAEKLLPADRQELETAFGATVFDTYGCREVMLIGAECEAHDGLHLSMENLIVEIIVTENGRTRPAREGETGEVVFTDLHNLAMPFIRYANGDIATAGARTRCSCGRSLPRIQAVQGRMSETLRDGTGAAVSGIAISFLFQDLGSAIRQFQAVQHKDQSVSINVVLADMLPRWRLDEVERNSKQLLRGLPVRVNVVPELPRSAAGKHRLVVVER
ncbi:MAG: hypothetical protein HOV81_14490 [Kofleriaceae bacterium]|nr:hypothetical protein [Kofleriaceae bacterium]